MKEIKILEILTKKAEKYNVSFCGVESNAIIETVNEALSLHNVSKQSELLLSELVEWLVINTNLDMEKVADFEERFKQ